MKKIFGQAKDKYVRHYVVYGNVEDHKLYEESSYTTQITEAELTDMFEKGLLIVVGDDTVVPVMVNANVATTLAKTGEPTEEFDAEETYAVGDVVLKDGVGYKCTTAISTATAWDATDWTEISTVDFISWTASATA